jgi:hypothetical protein
MTENASTNQPGQRSITSWMGVIAPASAQLDQIDTGYQWKYRVRIIGKHGGASVVPPNELDFALVLVPTTAGSGAGHRLRSVRISQGDTVYGIDDGFNKYIIGVFPRTTNIDYGQTNDFGSNLSGFTDGIKNKGPKGFINPNEETNNPVLSETAFTAPPIAKNERVNHGQDYLKQMGITIPNEGPIANSVTKPPRTPADQAWEPGMGITRQQLDYMIETDSPRVYDAYDQAVLQGIKTDNQRNDDLVNVSERVVEVENGEEAANLQSLINEAEDLQSQQQE